MSLEADPSPAPLRVLVVGAGAIGLLLGGRLALAGHDVTLVGREWLRAAVARDGLTIRTDDESRTIGAIEVLTRTADAFSRGQRYDFVLLTPKAYALPEAVREVVAAVVAPSPLVTFQNGVGSEEAAAALVGEGGVIAATITTPVEVLGEARIGTVHKGGIGLARWSPHSPDPAPLLLALRGSGFRAEQYEDARAMKWSKLLLNMLGNATSAILAWPPQRTMAHPRLYDVELDALAEARRVLRTLDIATVSLPGYRVPLQMLLLERLPRGLTRPLMQRIVAGSRGGKMPSLYLDLDAGRPASEIDVLNGAVARAGEAAGIPTPVNQTLTRLVRALTRGEEPRETYRSQPAPLLDAIERARRAVGA